MKKKFEIRKQGLLPGFDAGCYEPQRHYDRNEFASSFEDGLRRDNRISIRVSGKDLSRLKQKALEAGIPLQNFLSNIIHQYVGGELKQVKHEEAAGAPGARRDVEKDQARKLPEDS